MGTLMGLRHKKRRPQYCLQVPALFHNRLTNQPKSCLPLTQPENLKELLEVLGVCGCFEHTQRDENSFNMVITRQCPWQGQVQKNIRGIIDGFSLGVNIDDTPNRNPSNKFF